MTGARIWFDPGAVLFGDEGTILAVGPAAAVGADPRAGGAEVVDATGRAVLPGLHNCHLHSGLLRGTAESMSLWDWLRSYVDPAHRALTPEIAAVASRHCYAESVLAGTTSVMDMWRYMEGSAAAASEIGLRATLVPYVADEEGYDYFESTDSNRRLLEAVGCRKEARVRAWVGLEHLLYCSPAAFEAARHGRGPLRVARRPRDPHPRRHRDGGGPLPVLQHEAGVRRGPHRRPESGRGDGRDRQ
jgi:5-methylthioadenosine/S-adenosylhomocysteine deaminase